MKQQLEQVADWMRRFGQDTPTAPSIPPGKVRSLRHRITVEESRECRDAETSAKALDAIADQLFVVFGSAAAYGFTGDQVVAAFAEVLRSNDSKFWPAEALGGLSPDRQVRFAFNRGGKAFFIVFDEGGKVIKSPGWVPPDFSRILATTKE